MNTYPPTEMGSIPNLKMFKYIGALLVGSFGFNSCQSRDENWNSEAKSIPSKNGKNLSFETAAACDEVDNSFKKRGIKPSAVCYVKFEQSLWDRYWDGSLKNFNWVFSIGPNET